MQYNNSLIQIENLGNAKKKILVEGNFKTWLHLISVEGIFFGKLANVTILTSPPLKFSLFSPMANLSQIEIDAASYSKKRQTLMF